MGKFAYKMKNLFKSKEQMELEARMQFKQNKRSFTKYYNELEASVKTFSKMAHDAELSGNHENALSCARFVLKLQKTQTKVQGLLQRFEMMHSMQRLTGVMTNFMSACADMGFNMDANINLKDMWKNTAQMDAALSKLDAMSDQMDMVFDTIDNGMSSPNESIMTAEETNLEAAGLLDRIVGRQNIINAPAVPAAQPVQPAAEARPAAEAAADDTGERLRRMMQELRD